MVNISECPVCSNNLFQPFLTCKDFSITGQNFELIQCANCHFILTSPQPAVNDLGQYYNSTNYISHSDTSKGLINKIYRFIRNFTLKQKIKLIHKYFKQGTLLDIGSGAGYFLNETKKYKFDSIGIEPDSSTREKSIQQFDLKVYDETYIPDINLNSFDIITMWHVLEHVPNLNERLEQLKNLLKPNGILIIALPNCDSFDAQYYKNYWAGFDVPRHLWHFNPSTMESLASKYNFKLDAILPMYFDAFYVSLLSEKYKNSLLYFLKGLTIGFISNITALISGTSRYSSQIYIFKNANKT
ncbi:MAG: class I SAM-dependent methyltransferase [Saprospiraceae bacterium]|nr:class I SAM-dependent methyltransferase [Saprospiraceae bacterium]